MKFKVNDNVRVIKEGSHGQNIGDSGHIEDIAGSIQPYKVRLDKDKDYWWFEEDEIEYNGTDNIKVGDLVEINNNATIADFTINHWNGCQGNTLDFIRDFANKGLTFKVTRVGENKYLVLDNDVGAININIFKKVAIKEMTKDEIEKELGYKIKII